MNATTTTRRPSSRIAVPPMTTSEPTQVVTPSPSWTYTHFLIRRGYNYADIARAIGCDRSMIRQIAIGGRPGTTLSSGLLALARNDPPFAEDLLAFAPTRKRLGPDLVKAIQRRKKAIQIEKRIRSR